MVRNRRSLLRRTKRPGFTFVEMLAAMALIAIVIPVVIHGLTVANRAGVIASRRSVAAELADLKMNELLLNGGWRDSEVNGDFGEDRPGFRWTLEEESWDTDAMRRLTVTVIFKVQGREYEASISALVEEEVLG